MKYLKLHKSVRFFLFIVKIFFKAKNILGYKKKLFENWSKLVQSKYFCTISIYTRQQNIDSDQLILLTDKKRKKPNF